MVKQMYILVLFIATFQTSQIDDLQFLAGTWKVANKENYETWVLKEKGQLEGSSYKIRNNNKQVDEYLSIKNTGEKIIYTARVLNQNNAQPVEFTLNKMVKGRLSFENMAHDFPQKIQYTKLNDTTVFVAVLGDNGKGFSYKMTRQKTTNQ
jgi:K+/H+ antiporter YhaU regulatory subunit KhtT